jgi:hypothetical protein
MTDPQKRNPSSLTGETRCFEGKRKYACVEWEGRPVRGLPSVKNNGRYRTRRAPCGQHRLRRRIR